MKPLKISVVTPSYNQGHFLKQTIESVLGQKGDFELEYLVRDGGSTDGTIEILKSYGDRIRWVSQKDNGQTAAINEGFRLATGEVVAWLNSDDLYLPGTLQTVAEAFRGRPDAMWLIGGFEMIDENNNKIRRLHSAYKSFLIRHYSYRLLLTENVCPQPSVFFKKSTLEEVGYLSEGEYLVMDYDYWLRLGARWEPIIVDQPLSLFRFHAGSKTQNSQLREQFGRELELAKAHTRSKPWLYWLHVLNYLKTLLLYRWLKW